MQIETDSAGISSKYMAPPKISNPESSRRTNTKKDKSSPPKYLEIVTALGFSRARSIPTHTSSIGNNKTYGESRRKKYSKFGFWNKFEIVPDPRRIVIKNTPPVNNTVISPDVIYPVFWSVVFSTETNFGRPSEVPKIEMVAIKETIV